MTKIAIVDKCPGHINYIEYFKLQEYASTTDIYHLCSTKLKKVLKRDVDLVLNTDDYDFVILVGSEACSHLAKVGSVTTYAGHLIDDKYIPMMNPAMLSFKPEAEKPFFQAVAKMLGHINGTIATPKEGLFKWTEDYEEARTLLLDVQKNKGDIVAFDSETSALDPREGHMLGISLTYKHNQGYYISSDVLYDDNEIILAEILESTRLVAHNSKFDKKWFRLHLGIPLKALTEDTMLMHYVLDESQGTHGLKHLAMKYTIYGDYDKELDVFKKDYCKRNRVLQKDFSYESIPFDVIGKYACIDTAATYDLYQKFKPSIDKSPQFSYVYNQLLVRGTEFLIDVEENGVPFSIPRIQAAREKMDIEIASLKSKLYEIDEVHAFEKKEEKVFNPNSTVQLRKILFEYAKLKPTGKKTATKADSTDSEVLEELAKQHPLPQLILDIRQLSKIKNTYLDKIIVGLNKDSRLRTGFNLTTTTSGRLSSSGKLNMQQLPRDNKLVKGCLKARPGYVIVSQDLGTAEMYYAAVLSGDRKLQLAFINGEDFHSSIAKMVFNLDCEISEVKSKYPSKRQAAKAISFGILYGSGPAKVAATVMESNREAAKKTGEPLEYYSEDDAVQDIRRYFKTYSVLKAWLNESKKYIQDNGYIYSAFGRKRRLANVWSSDRGIVGSEVRSGINFLIQSVSSDINLLAGIEMNDYIKSIDMDAKIFGLVHDSILAEVKEEELEHFRVKMAEFTQKDRGLSIPNCPISVDFEVGDDYSFGELEYQYPDIYAIAA